MGRVETGRGAVAPQDIRIVPGKSSPAVVVGPVDRSGVGVSSLDQQTVRELPIGGNLQGVIVRAQIALPEVRFCSTAGGSGCRVERINTSELLEERLTCLSSARKSSVDVEVSELVNRLSANVAR